MMNARSIPMAIAVMMLMIIALPSAQAGKAFLDDFEDGSATDGNPVSWVAPGYAQTGTRVVQDGSLVLTANIPFEALDTDVAGETYGDVSIRTQFLATSEDAVCVYARSNVIGQVGGPVQGQQIYAIFLSTGILSLDRWVNGNAQVLDYTNVGWDATGKEVHMELSLFDKHASVFIWQDGTSRPSEPLVDADLSGIVGFLEEGRIGICSMPWPTPTTGPVAFRFVEVVPEPSTALLAAFSLLGLVLSNRRVTK